MSKLSKLLETIPPVIEMAEAFADDNCECEHGFICGNHGDILELKWALEDLKVQDENHNRDDRE